MALIYEKGTLSFKSEIQSGTSKAGNTWQRQTIVIDVPGYQGTFRKVALNASNREMDDVNMFPVGSWVKVGFQVSAREWNGKWYNDVNLFTIEPGEASNEPQEARPAPQAKPIQATPEDLDPETHGDLPF